MPIRLLLSLAVCFALFGADEWPQWRGPARDGIAPSLPAASAWPEKLKLKWKVTVGEGHASPVVAGGKIYLHSRQGEKEVVSCLNAADGKAVWQQSYDAPYKMSPPAVGHGKGAKSTPVVSGGRVFTLGISGILSAFDAASGKPLWRKEFTPPDYGTAMSPIAYGDVVVAHVGHANGGALVAFDARTGAEKWNWKSDGPGYTSPIIVELAGVRQLVTQSRKNIVSVSPSTGETLWQIPYATAYDQNSVTPAVYRDLLIFSGLSKGVMAVKVSKRGSALVPETVWENKDLSMYMNSPVVVGDRVYGFANRNRGQYFCMDARTGAVVWTSDPRQGDNAAILANGATLLLLSTDATMLVANGAGAKLETLRKYTVADSPTWAHPAPVERGILIKDATTLARWELQ